MAALDASSATDTMRCCIHFPTNKDELIQNFTTTTFQKCSSLAVEWIKYNCYQADIARRFLAATQSLTCFEDAKKESFGFHRYCYQQFTRKDRLQQLQNREGCDKEEVNTKDIDDVPPRKKLRSTDTLTQACKNKRRNEHVLPNLCIFCKKERKSHMQKSTGKKSDERLSVCEQKQFTRLEAAAVKRKDEELLSVIKDKDLVAIELRYHLSCLRRYINDAWAIGQSLTYTGNAKWQHSNSYRVFMENVIVGKLVKKRRVFRMTRLAELLTDIAKDVEKCALPMKTCQLKDQLLIDFPNLVFLQPSASNQSEIVLYDGVVADFVTPFAVCDADSSDEETSTDSESERQHNSDAFSAQEDTRTLYHMSMQLNHQVHQAGQKCPTSSIWPPEAKDMTEDKIQKIIPVQLFNCLAWIVGASSEYTQNELVSLSDSNKRKIFSICQDIMNVHHKGKMYLPKHYALGMSVRQHTGSAKLISILNGLGHCMSNTTVLEHDTALAEQQMVKNNNVPEGFQKGQHTNLAWDNNDFGEETFSGKGTTHNTNGIIVQRVCLDGDTQPDNISVSTSSKLNRSKKRTLPFAEEPLPEYYMHRRVGPQQLVSEEFLCAFSSALSDTGKLHRLDLAMTFSKLLKNLEDANLPSWTGFNACLKKDIPAPSKIGYLPVINGSPTQLKTVNVVFQSSLAIADELNLDAITLVFDLAFYAKAQQVRWYHQQYLERTVVRLGEFHTCMSFFTAIGKRFQESGLSQILLEADVIAHGSLESVMKGRHYNRCIRILNIMTEALRRLQLEEFFSNLDDTEKGNYEDLSERFRKAFPQNEFMETVHSEPFQNFMQRFTEYVQQKCAKLPTYSFWNSYLQMSDLLHNFVRATRDCNWDLHLTTAAGMVPWFFAYDCLNYARYIPVYLFEMASLDKTHPSVAASLPDNFVVQQQDRHAFSQTAMDQTIEQTANRDTKTKGGLTGFSQNAAAVHRWILSHAKRAEITQMCNTMAGLTSRENKPVSQAQADREECEILDLMDTIKRMQNPFSYNVDELVNIASGQVVADNATVDILNAYNKGRIVAQNFVEDRLIKKTVEFQAPVKQMKLPGFNTPSKSSTSVRATTDSKQLRMGKELMTRLLLVARDRKLDLRDLLSHNLTQFPPSISCSDGSLQRTTKAALLHFFAKTTSDSLVKGQQKGEALIIDGMALIQEKSSTVPPTFGEYSVSILRHIIRLANFFYAKRIDFVTDRYNASSIKNAERNRRAGGSQQSLQRSLSSEQKTPQQFRKLLMSGKSKESLCQFLVCHWQTLNGNELDGKILYATQGEHCLVMSADVNNGIRTEEVAELASDHEEADTRLILHAKHASTNGAHDVIIKSPDTDVFLLSVANVSEVSCQLYFATGCGNNSRILNANAVAEKLGPNAAQAILGFHAFTGCDSTSSLKGKGKIKPLQVMLQSPVYVDVFAKLGQDWDVSPQQLPALEEFVCKLYGQKVKMVNDARHNIFRLTCKSDHSLPPNDDSLFLHVQRANYQTAIWRRCLATIINKPMPLCHGWMCDPDDPQVLVVQWMKNPPAPSSVVQLVKCGCKGNCASNRCGCKSADMPCTDLCQCPEGCSNAKDKLCEEDSDSEENDGISEDTDDEA